MFSNQYQMQLIRQIKDHNVDDQMLKDIIQDDQERASGRKALYNRFKLKPASFWEEDMTTCEFDGVPVFNREIEKGAEKMKVNHRLHLSSDRRIVQTFVGYLSKPLQIAYNDVKNKNEARQKLIYDKITDFLRNNDFELLQSEISKNCCLLGSAYILAFVQDGQIKLMSLDTWETIVIKNNFDQVEYALRYWEVTVTENGAQYKSMHVEFYDDRFIWYYKQNKDGKFVLDIDGYLEIEDVTGAVAVSIPAGARPHFFARCPILEIPKNKEKISDVEITLPLQDALDVTESDLSSEVSQLRLAYLQAKRLGLRIDTEFLQRLKQTGILEAGENGEWSFVEKNLNIDAIKYLIDELKSNITKYSNSVDFSSKDFQDDIRVIGWGIKMKPLEESAIEFENNFFASLRKLFEIVFIFWETTDVGLKGLDRNNLTFTLPRNIPQNIGMEVDNFVKLYGKVSDETAYNAIPSIVKNVQEEIERVSKEGDTKREQLQGFMDQQQGNQDQQNQDNLNK